MPRVRKDNQVIRGKVMNIEPVIKLLLDYNENLGMRDIGTPYLWLNSGCDMEKDILPTIKEIIKRRNPTKPKISTFSYFTNAILSARDRRSMPVLNKKEPTTEEKEAARAKTLRWAKDKGIQTTSYGPRDFAWLEQYEQTHGGKENPAF